MVRIKPFPKDLVKVKLCLATYRSNSNSKTLNIRTITTVGKQFTLMAPSKISINPNMKIYFKFSMTYACLCLKLPVNTQVCSIGDRSVSINDERLT